MKQVRDLLKGKQSEIISVGRQCTVFDALQTMAARDIGAVVVMENEALVGIFSERDYARKVVLAGKSSKDLIVGDIMTEKVYVVDGSCSIEECMQIMTTRKIRHLPVYEETRLSGIISIGDVLKNVLEEKEFVINQLEQYIVGGSFKAK